VYEKPETEVHNEAFRAAFAMLADLPKTTYFNGLATEEVFLVPEKMPIVAERLQRLKTQYPVAFTLQLWKQACYAFKKYWLIVARNDRGENSRWKKDDNGMIYPVNKQYLIDKQGYNAWIEAFRFKDSLEQRVGVDQQVYSPKYQSPFFLSSEPHMMNQFKAILGFSGSIGSQPEKLFLEVSASDTAFFFFNLLTPPLLLYLRSPNRKFFTPGTTTCRLTSIHTRARTEKLPGMSRAERARRARQR